MVQWDGMRPRDDCSTRQRSRRVWSEEGLDADCDCILSVCMTRSMTSNGKIGEHLGEVEEGGVVRHVGRVQWKRGRGRHGVGKWL